MRSPKMEQPQDFGRQGSTEIATKSVESTFPRARLARQPLCAEYHHIACASHTEVDGSTESSSTIV